MATSAESIFAQLVEADLAWNPSGIFARLPLLAEILEEELTQDALPGFGHSWPGYAARRVAGGHRADGEGGDDGESLCRARGAPSPWTSVPEEGYEYELAQFDSPHEPALIEPVKEGYEYELAQFDPPHEPALIAGFFMDTPVPAGSARAEAAARPAPPKQAPEIVTTLMVQNLSRSITRRAFMLSLDEQGFAGKYDFVHLPTAFGTRRNMGFAFVNFKKLEDAEEFARYIARIKGSKMRVVPAEVQGLNANAWQASSRKMTRIRNSASRPWVVGGHDQDAPLHA